MKLRGATLDDVEGIVSVIRAADEADGAAPDMNPEDLVSYWREIDPEQDVLVAEDDDGNLVGYVDVTPSSRDAHIDAYVHPAVRGLDVHSRLLRGAEAIAARQVDVSLPRRATIIHGSDAGKRLLEAEGYRHIRSFFRMRIDLAAPPPEVEWPDGIAVRGYARGDDRLMHEALTEAFADHWEPHQRPLEDFVRLQLDEQFVPEASFLAFAGDEVAGALLGKKRYGMGWVQSIGVRRPWRRIGLGLALLLQAFRSFYDLGERSIGLGVDAENTTGATRLYERAGMHVEVQFDTYEKRFA